MPKYQQLIFIDDSGDPGFKLNRGSSQLFVIACIIFDSPVSAEYTAASLKMLKEQMGWKQEREFKFHRANDEQKKLFFNTIKKCEFKIRAIVVDKNKIVEPNLKKSESFYSYVIEKVLDDYKDMHLARISLDGSGNRSFRKKSTAKIRQAINKGNHRMIDFRLVDSKDSVLIQLADMVAGAIMAKYDKNKHLKHDYLRMLKAQTEDIGILR
ncbi:DUF3800 domain-containing protein [Candidatus Saccharibacteria bacterium]|nr:DUF3800 domain-containing protein [Candidatus Saccharibacteria bacterium]